MVENGPQILEVTLPVRFRRCRAEIAIGLLWVCISPPHAARSTYPENPLNRKATMSNPLEYACAKQLAYRKRRFAWAREIGRPIVEA